jgi:hypothetical protein
MDNTDKAGNASANLSAKVFDLETSVGQVAGATKDYVVEKAIEAKDYVVEKGKAAQQYAGEKCVEAENALGEKIDNTRAIMAEKIAGHPIKPAEEEQH